MRAAQRRFQRGRALLYIRTPRDPVRGLSLVRQAAEAGLCEARRLLARCYLLGLAGLREDDEQAVYWLGKAAAQGDAGAAGLLRMLNSPGPGT